MSSSDDADRAGESRPANGIINRRDLVVSALLIAICGGLYLVTGTFEQASDLLGQNVLPEEFPRILLVLISALALLLPFEHRFQPARWRKIDSVRDKPVVPRTWSTIAFLLLVVIAAPFLGTILTMLLICLILPVMWGERRWLLIALFAAIFTSVITYLFNTILKVYFEPGLLSVFT